MSVIHTPVSLEKGLKTTFLQHYMMDLSLVNTLAWVIQSDSDLEKYEWLGQAPRLQEFLDERRPQQMTNTSYTITNKTWESTVNVLRDHLMDGKTGSIKMRIMQMAAVASGHYHKLLIDKIVLGTTDNGYDGVTFYNNAHPARGDAAAWDNLLDGTGVTTATIATDLNTAEAQMLGFPAENNEPFFGDVLPELYIVCGPTLAKPFREVLGADMISQTTNLQQGRAKLHITPRLTDTNDWYLFGVNNAAKPMIMQEREALRFQALEDTSGDIAFNRRLWQYGIDGRHEVGFGFPQCSVKVVNS